MMLAQTQAAHDGRNKARTFLDLANQASFTPDVCTLHLDPKAKSNVVNTPPPALYLSQATRT